MNKKRILGFVLILIGMGIIISNFSITGAVIGTSISNSLSLVGVVFFIIGTVLMTYQERSPQERIEDIVEKYKVGTIDVVHAAAELNKIIPIQNVKYRTGKQHTLVGDRNAYPLDLKTGRKAEELAMTEYLLAVRNNPIGIRQSNIEIKKGLSTKHYMKKFQEALEEFKLGHSKDLEAVLGIPV